MLMAVRLSMIVFSLTCNALIEAITKKQNPASVAEVLRMCGALLLLVIEEF